MKKQDNNQHYITSAAIAIMTLISFSAFGENAVESPWHVSVTAGRLDFEGNEAVYDTFLPSVHLGYDLAEKWTVEGILGVTPDLNENFRNSYGEQISRLEENAGPGIHNTYSIRMGLEGLYHFDRTRTVDPYLAAGCGMIWYAKDFKNQFDPELTAGAGILFHLNSRWAIRLDGRVFATGLDNSSEFNSLVSAGITWTPSVGAPVKSHVSPVTPPASPTTVKPLEIRPVVTTPAENDENAKKYELHIEFADNSAEITAQYYGELDVIGKELRDQADSKAKIGAHVDQRKNSVEKDALQLTEKRAKAVQEYLSSHWKIRKSRMESVGYGFSKPKEKADLDNGNLANRRIEISIIPPAGKK